jgi:hypothetical protein
MTTSSERDRPWLPADFVHPRGVDLSTGHHLRPITADDTELDMVAVMGPGSGSGPCTSRPGAGR